MARVTVLKGSDELVKSLESLGKNMLQVAEDAVRAGADVLADEVRSRLEKNLSGSEHSTGALLDSFGITPAKVSENGVVDVKVGFSGYDPERKPTPKYPRGVPNAIKARAMESGTSKQQKRPFFRPAINHTRKKIPEAMQGVVDAAVRKYVKE